MHLLTKDQLLAVKGRRVVEIEVPELGGRVRLASPTASAAIALRALHLRAEKGENVEEEIAVTMLSCALVDADGKPLLSASDARAWIEGAAIETVTRLMSVVTEFVAAELGAKKGAQDNAGNSAGSPSAS